MPILAALISRASLATCVTTLYVVTKMTRRWLWRWWWWCWRRHQVKITCTAIIALCKNHLILPVWRHPIAAEKFARPIHTKIGMALFSIWRAIFLYKKDVRARTITHIVKTCFEFFFYSQTEPNLPEAVAALHDSSSLDHHLRPNHHFDMHLQAI